jgi:hypothetical protein
MMHVYIPLADGTKIPQEVINSILEQGMCVIHPVSRPGSVIQGDQSAERIKGEIASREAIRMEAIGKDEDVIVIQDSDVVHLKTTNFDDMKKFMESHPEVGAVAISPTEPMELEPDHVLLQCIMVRVSVLSKIKFRADSGKCSCNCFGEDVRKSGHKYGYLDRMVRIKEIQRN